MPLLGFQSRFAQLVESGEKRQTIRAYRKDGRDPKPGDRLYLWTGLRTKGARKLGEAVAIRVTPIEIRRRMAWLPGVRNRWLKIDVYLEGPRGGRRKLTSREVVALSIRDGFTGPALFGFFFELNHGLPFHGLLIEWGDIAR